MTFFEFSIGDSGWLLGWRAGLYQRNFGNDVDIEVRGSIM
jgi:hypothetical protein